MSLDSRCVFDTNSLVSALLFDQSVPGRAFFAALGRGKLLLSEATFAEVRRVLRRKKFDRYLSSEDRDKFLAKLLRDSLLIEIIEEIRACRDPKDDMFLELAVSGEATCLVSGDLDLLVLDPFRGIPIRTPAQFLESIEAAGQ
jgi:uncharacterized protein